eukprot:2134564-Pyramimonas_sp.AAC.1
MVPLQDRCVQPGVAVPLRCGPAPFPPIQDNPPGCCQLSFHGNLPQLQSISTDTGVTSVDPRKVHYAERELPVQTETRRRSAYLCALPGRPG